MKINNNTKAILIIVSILILIVAITLVIAEMEKETYKDRLNTTITVNNYINIPNTNLTCVNPILIDNYYYCNIDDVEVLK